MKLLNRFPRWGAATILVFFSPALQACPPALQAQEESRPGNAGLLHATPLGTEFSQKDLEAIGEALEQAEANVKGMLAIFTYGFDISTQNFEKQGIDLHTLSDYDHLLEQALDTRYISEKEKLTLQTWRLDPENWNAAN